MSMSKYNETDVMSNCDTHLTCVKTDKCNRTQWTKVEKGDKNFKTVEGKKSSCFKAFKVKHYPLPPQDDKTKVNYITDMSSEEETQPKHQRYTKILRLLKLLNLLVNAKDEDVDLIENEVLQSMVDMAFTIDDSYMLKVPDNNTDHNSRIGRRNPFLCNSTVSCDSSSYHENVSASDELDDNGEMTLKGTDARKTRCTAKKELGF